MVDGRTLFFQGTLLVDFDPARMIEVLRIPVDKLARRDLEDARRRVVSLRELLGACAPLDEVDGALLSGFRDHLGLEPAWAKRAGPRSASRAGSRGAVRHDEFGAR